MSNEHHDFEGNLNAEDRDALKAYMAEHRHASKEEAQQKIVEAKKERLALEAQQTGSEEESRKERKQRNRRKSNQYAIIAGTIVVIIIAFFGMHMVQEKAKAKTLATNVQAAKTALADHYVDKAKIYPKAESSTSEINKLKATIAKTKEDETAYKSLNQQYQTYKEKNTALKNVNGLYTDAVIEGKERKTGTLRTTTDKVPKAYGETDGFYQLANEALDEASNQLTDTKNAKNVVADLFDGTNVKDSVTREQYKQAKAAVAKVKNETQQKALNVQLTKVDEKLKTAEEKAAAQKAAAEKAAKAKAAAAQKAAAEKAAAEKAKAEIATRAGTGTPIMKANQSQIKDTSNPAWTWKAGVLEKVIQTSVARGYITADGYLLRKNSIVNGEGYYDLYATNLNSNLMKQFSQNELPVYLFTINDKTGWFKGNGPN